MKISIAPILFTILATALCLHCSTSASAKPVHPSDKFFIVTFASTCCGPDAEAQKRVDSFLDDFYKKYPGTPQFQVVQWGEEGEFDYCFPASKINPILFRALKDGIFHAAESSRQVSMHGAPSCDHR